MPNCPTCRVPLESDHVGRTLFRVCHGCGGSLIPLPAVREAIRQDLHEQLVAHVRGTRAEGTRSCPRCNVAMTSVAVPRGPRPVALDVCYPCDSVWFDAREYDVLKSMYGMDEPAISTPAGKPKWRRKLRNAVGYTLPTRELLDHRWKWAPALLGMPVEQRSAAMLSRPWLTWMLAAVIALVSIAVWTIPVLRFQFSLVPALVWRMGGLTLLTSFFLHAGILHLVSNLYFLLVFGDNVEDYLGKSRYLLLLFSATLAGDMFHIAIDPNSTIPVVGASGGISGVLVFYGLQFPRVRLLILMRSYLFYPLRLRACWAVAIWILLQFFGVWAQIKGFSNVSALAHLGGAAVGLLFWLVWKTRLGVSPKPSGASAPA